jgi:cyclohexanone monooxygenase
LTAAAAAIAAVVRHAEDRGAKTVEVTKQAEDAWRKFVRSGSGGMLGALDCTPSYYNHEGKVRARGHRKGRGYPGGQLAYFRYLDAWCSSGRFDGLSFSG